MLERERESSCWCKALSEVIHLVHLVAEQKKENLCNEVLFPRGEKMKIASKRVIRPPESVNKMVNRLIHPSKGEWMFDRDYLAKNWNKQGI